jgi:hypothetical protein
MPCVIEAWAEVSDTAAFDLFINRTPSTADVEVHHTAKDKGLILIGCGLRERFAVGPRPVRVFLNIETPYMPITSDGKTPDLSALVDDIAYAIGRAARKAKRQSPGVRCDAARIKDVVLNNLAAAVAQASYNGRYRYSLRQLFYAVRPYVSDAIGGDLNYGTFTGIITRHEAATGRDLPGMYRDSRGSLYHPHTGETIPLGTLYVEKYRRPAWTFNKVLYCEKEGFFPILRDAKWPERHDCALMTSKGYASRAARDVIDMFGESDEELQFFLIHDADAAGTMIYQAIQEATDARPGRRVRIINLGLEPAEAVQMNLAVEDVQAKGKRLKRSPVANYVDPEWAGWLQSHRVELNAMTSGQFLAWLDGKFEQAVGKVIPPADVLAAQLGREVRVQLERRITDSVIRDAGIPGLVEQAYRRRQPLVDEGVGNLTFAVESCLTTKPELPWTVPVQRVAAGIAAPRAADRASGSVREDAA